MTPRSSLLLQMGRVLHEFLLPCRISARLLLIRLAGSSAPCQPNLQRPNNHGARAKGAQALTCRSRDQSPSALLLPLANFPQRQPPFSPPVYAFFLLLFSLACSSISLPQDAAIGEEAGLAMPRGQGEAALIGNVISCGSSLPISPSPAASPAAPGTLPAAIFGAGLHHRQPYCF